MRVAMCKIMFLLLVFCIIFYSYSSLGRICYLINSFPVVVSFIICIRSRLGKKLDFGH